MGFYAGFLGIAGVPAACGHEECPRAVHFYLLARPEVRGPWGEGGYKYKPGARRPRPRGRQWGYLELVYLLLSGNPQPKKCSSCEIPDMPGAVCSHWAGWSPPTWKQVPQTNVWPSSPTSLITRHLDPLRRSALNPKPLFVMILGSEAASVMSVSITLGLTLPKVGPIYVCWAPKLVLLAYLEPQG